jgi:hypothetical protein
LLPIGLFLHPGLVDGYIVPFLVSANVPGLERQPISPALSRM